jgi:hypothetical protein
MQELTKFFELVVAMQYDEYLEYFKLNEWEVARNLQDFSRLPRTPLHEKFNETIRKECNDIREANETAKLKQMIQENEKNSETDSRYQNECNFNYQIIKDVDSIDEKRILIAIPYVKWTKIMFGFWLYVSEKITPMLYSKLIKTLLRRKN